MSGVGSLIRGQEPGHWLECVFVFGESVLNHLSLSLSPFSGA